MAEDKEPLTVPRRVKVLYIAGMRRSGSTVLGNLLGEATGCWHGGELALLWAFVAGDGPCSCGVPVRRCPTWQAVFAQMSPPMTVEDALATAIAVQRRFLGRWLPFLLWVPGLWRLLVPRALRPARRDRLLELYRAIIRETGAGTVIDSSKSPGYGFLLSLRKDIDLHVVHLVRDAPANVDSATRRLHHALPALTRMDNVLVRSVQWLVWHLSVEALWNWRSRHRRRRQYLRVRYEDFARDPRASLTEILEFAGAPAADAPIEGTRGVLRGNHSISGNPGVARQGAVVVEEDRAWAERMSPLRRRAVTLLAFPLRRRYYE